MIRSQTLWVTGASSGIGRATAEAFAAAGASVIAADIDDTAGRETVEAIVGSGGIATFVHCYVTDPESVEALVKAAVDEYGGLDFAHDNAGIEGHLRPTAEMTLDEFRRVIDVNLVGVFLCMKYQIPVMRGFASSRFTQRRSRPPWSPAQWRTIRTSPTRWRVCTRLAGSAGSASHVRSLMS